MVRTYAPEQMGELTAKVLPELGAAHAGGGAEPAAAAPSTATLKPRILLELQQLESGLSVLPTLVYGAPPSVRIDNGRMVYLRGRGARCATRPPSSGSSTSSATS